MQFQKQKYWIERKFEVQSYDKIFFSPHQMCSMKCSGKDWEGLLSKSARNG